MPATTTKVALVTGAAKRIGAEIVRQLHKEHFNVVIHYHQSDKAAKELANELNEERENSAYCIAADLNNMEQINNLAMQAQQHWQRLDLLVNNASSFYPTPIGETSEEDWDQLINSNLKAPFFLAQALAKKLGEYHGCIINIADIYADKPLKKHSIYSIAKAGNAMLTKTLAQELAPMIRVNGIAPGAILWPDDSHKKPEDRLSDDNKEKMLAKIPLQQRGQAQDIARTILFLTQSPYITGQILTVDGGRTITI
ncbi:pteridine reductase [Cellvibrio fibrivorans]|jgi:pteridine reductase|uniref:Pteridine reductase n=1 Tax=Cellvibrio fibrivorans TaxID=126350 RepID=A0ABU1USE8_9GAMM|nr:pteridine reductase [Cellvibrio fibrivorans]MDR7088110.1 pteridine reductase [Cellvibrio fibrivorans]